MDFTTNEVVSVTCLPDTACCKADEERRSPLELNRCPLGCETCSGDCEHYSEDPTDKLKNTLELDFGPGNTLFYKTDMTTAKEALYELQDGTPRINWCAMSMRSAKLFGADGKIDELLEKRRDSQ